VALETKMPGVAGVYYKAKNQLQFSSPTNQE